MITIVSSIISSVFQLDNKRPDATPLRAGQVFNGKILKLFPNQTAEVQIGNQRMIAQLDVPLEVGRHYWLQVQPSEGTVELKLLDNNSLSLSRQEGLETVFKAFSLSSSKENVEVVKYFLKEQLPISKELVQNAANWIKNSTQPLEELNTINWMIKQGYPVTKDIYHALISMNGKEKITEIMQSVLNGLQEENQITSVSSSLKEVLTTLISNEETPQINFQSTFLGDEKTFHPLLKKLIESLGFQYEKDVFTFLNGQENESIRQDNLKGLLIQYLSEKSDISQKEPAEQLLQRITGMQLLSKDMGPVQQFIMQIPFPLWNRTTDLTLQWSGRKNEDGKIDPNFCRVIFYLELETLKETMVDLRIQNRIISIKVLNENHQLLKELKSFQAMLKENLKKMSYNLSSLEFEDINDKQFNKRSHSKLPITYQNQSYTGVDIKV
ncbi:hypothetical protein ACFSO7_05835 [Bacillus sp. CGMCC 1.16607]|uniref:hypothetical protein n=1 Tax=Bacillus sp. CGMCC 1.16607 TaxID=3351842 RepID=UPI0036327BBA